MVQSVPAFQYQYQQPQLSPQLGLTWWTLGLLCCNTPDSSIAATILKPLVRASAWLNIWSCPVRLSNCSFQLPSWEVVVLQSVEWINMCKYHLLFMLIWELNQTINHKTISFVFLHRWIKLSVVGKLHVETENQNPESAKTESENNFNTLAMTHSGQVARSPQLDE